MSYPLHKLNDSSNARTVRTQSGFWGLDAAAGDFDRGPSCSKDAQNLIWQGEALKVRPGYRSLCKFSGRINGIYLYQDTPVIHAGTGLYTLPEADDEPVLIYEGMADAVSKGTVRNQTAVKRICRSPLMDAWWRETVTRDFLFLNDGEHYLIYDGEAVRSVTDPYWGEATRERADQGEELVYYAAVPFTAVAKLPADGGGDVDPRGDNQLTQFRCESFYVDSDTTATDFVLSCPYEAYNNGIPPELQIRCDDGLWHNVDLYINNDYLRTGDFARVILPKLSGGMSVSIDLDGRINTLDAGTNVIIDDGMDNIRLTYAVFKDPPDAITGATVQGFYGPDGGKDVLFLGGSTAAPGTDTFSEPNDFFCFFETSTERLGNSHTPVTGYCHLNDGRMAVLKNDPNDSNIFFRSYKQLSVGTTMAGESYTVDAYPSVCGAAVEGCLSAESVGVVGNEPCFLAKSGLFSVRGVSDELTNLNETVRRSVSVDPLLQSLTGEEVHSICWNGYYLLTFGATALITDGRKTSDGSFRFLKWVFSHPITALGQQNGSLYLGSRDGELFVLDGSADDAGTSISAYWTLPLLEEQKGRRMLLRRLWADVSGNTGILQVGITDHNNAFRMLDVSLETLQNAESSRWVSLLQNPRLAENFSVKLDLSSAREALLWGYRMIYEKGGLIR